jgi:hypothetical protein
VAEDAAQRQAEESTVSREAAQTARMAAQAT